jgi:hypothetical protein
MICQIGFALASLTHIHFIVSPVKLFLMPAHTGSTLLSAKVMVVFSSIAPVLGPPPAVEVSKRQRKTRKLMKAMEPVVGRYSATFGANIKVKLLE